jgi:ERCC4-type nuclease
MQFKFVKRRLPVADYTIKGYEDIIAVERKSGFKEFIGNLTGKKRMKFEKYLEKLAEYELGILVIEENLNSLQRVFRELKFSRMTPEGVFHWVNKIVVEYGIPVICMDCKGRNKEKFLYQLFDQLLQEAERIHDVGK